MANRRDFIAAAGGAGLASMGGLGAAGSETSVRAAPLRDRPRTFELSVGLGARGQVEVHGGDADQGRQAPLRGDSHGTASPYLECSATRLPSLSRTTARKPYGPIWCLGLSTLPPFDSTAEIASSRRP